MDDNPLRCDGCARESWPDGSLVLVVRADDDISTVKTVRVTCGATCASNDLGASVGDGEPVVFSFEKIPDVFDYADHVIAAHDWERGTVQRLSRVLAALHRKRVPNPP